MSVESTRDEPQRYHDDAVAVPPYLVDVLGRGVQDDPPSMLDPAATAFGHGMNRR